MWNEITSLPPYVYIDVATCFVYGFLYIFWHFVSYDRLYVHRQSFDDYVPKRLCEVCMILLRFSSVSDVPYVRLEEIKLICF